MLNPFQTQPETEQAYSTLTPPQAVLTHPQKSDGKNTLAVHQWLAKIQRKARRDKIRFWSLFIFFQTSLLLFIPLTNTFPLMRNNHVNPLALALLFLPAISTALLALWALLSKPAWNAEELVRVGGVEAVGTLLDLLPAPKSSRQLTLLYAALTQLLPQMKAGDATTLTAGQRRMLNGSLKSGYGYGAAYQNYRLAILKAMEQIGDSSAIPIVEHLANARARTASQRAIKAAAMECLPLLRVNSGDATATKTLLRASSPEQSAPDILLRPAGSVRDARPEQLLRVTDPTASPPAAASGTQQK